LTFPEMADAVETVISAAPNVLWGADGDTGYGNALAVLKTIRAYARRGAAAVLIEDKVWPRPLGHGGAKLVIERDAALLRCRAAAEACREEGIPLLDDPSYFPASDGGASARGSQSSTVVPSPTLLRIRIAPRD
jgi:2-methylisocitrate lyase-like PEP mutase family enzyme